MLIESGFVPDTEFCNVTENGNARGPNLAKIQPQTGGISSENSNDYCVKDKKNMGRRRFELRTPAMSRRYLNQARPPALIQ